MNLWRVFLVVSALVFVGCDYNHQKGGATLAPKAPIPDSKLTNPDYATVNSMVLKDRCVRCHSASGGMKGGFDMEGYEKVASNLKLIYERVFIDQDMPPRPLPAAEEELLKTWLDQGAPLKTRCDLENDPNFDCTPLTWVNVTKRILEPKCVSCHSATDPQGGLNMSDLTIVRAKSAQIMDRTFVKKDMPIDPILPLNLEERRALFNWIDLGMPE